MLVKLRYVDIVNTSFSLNTFKPIVYRINSPYSPLGIHSPGIQDAVAGYSVMAKMYQFYRVNAAKVVVDVQVLDNRYNNAGRANSVIGTLSFEAQPDAAPPYDLPTTLQTTGNPFCVWDTATGSNDSRVHLENYVKLEKLLGSKQLKYDDNYASSTSGSPSSIMEARLTFAVPTAGTFAPNLTCSMIASVDFYVEFYTLITQLN